MFTETSFVEPGHLSLGQLGEATPLKNGAGEGRENGREGTEERQFCFMEV